MDLPFCNKLRDSLVHTFRTQANGQRDDESDSRREERELQREIGRPFDQPFSCRGDGNGFFELEMYFPDHNSLDSTQYKFYTEESVPWQVTKQANSTPP
jgi:hypothetical protein